MPAHLIPTAILIAQCTGPFCGPDSDFEHPAAGLLGESAAPVTAATEDGAVLLAWEFRGEGEADIVFSRREPGPDGGWSTPVRLDTDGWGEARSLEPRIVATSSEVVVVLWQDDRGGADHLYHRRSTDGGRTWDAEDRPLPGGENGGLRSMASMAADAEGRIHVVWEDLRDGRRDLWTVRSTDHGVSWEPELRVDEDPPGTGVSYHPQLLAWDDGSALVAWWDERDGRADVYVRRRAADGSWAGPEMRIDPGEPGAHNSRDVVLDAHGDVVSVTWEESAPGLSGNVVSRTSIDRGATWAAIQAAGAGEDPVVVARSPAGPLLAWAEPPPPGRGEKTSIGGRIVDLPPPTRMPVRAANGRRASLEGLERLAGRWCDRSETTAFFARGGSAAGRGLVDLYAVSLDAPDLLPRRVALLRFGAELMTTDIDVRARSLAGAVTPDGAVHLVWVTSYGERDDLGAIRLAP